MQKYKKFRETPNFSYLCIHGKASGQDIRRAETLLGLHRIPARTGAYHPFGDGRALTLAAGEKALVVPMAAKPTLAVTCTIDGEEFTTSITADTMPSLLAGVEYEITLTVIGQEAVISSVKEVPWTTTEVNGGTIY